MHRSITVALILILIAAHIGALGKAAEQEKLLPKGQDAVYAIPSPILNITALEFHGIASDFLFLKSLVFFGSTLERKERPRVKPWEWKWLYGILDASTDLDPYFLDPYYFANATLLWEGQMIRETNALLEKGSRHRDWDSLLPFYMGFNLFYFLDENEKASEYLMEASRRPGTSPLYVSLAAKLAYKAKRTENAIAFLELILSKTDDELTRAEYQNRIQVLQGILVLERAVQTYEMRYGRKPAAVRSLLQAKIIHELPPDPFGGNYYIDERGEVRTTSEDRIMPHKKQN